MRQQMLAAMACVTLLALTAPAANAQTDRVEVESRTVYATETFEIGVFLENSVQMKSIVVPLVIRSASGGAYPSAIEVAYNPDGRLPVALGAPLYDVKLIWWSDEEDGSCLEGQAGGFGTHTLQTEEYNLNVANPSSPDGLTFVRSVFISRHLQAGTDFPIATGEPSISLSLQASSLPGSFEIDTTCSDPANHLVFVTSANPTVITPDFAKGVIEVLACDCPFQGDMNHDGVWDAVDLNLHIDLLFAGGCCPGPYGDCPTSEGDLNGDGFSDAADLNDLIDLLFFGGPYPCNPCNPIGIGCID